MDVRAEGKGRRDRSSLFQLKSVPGDAEYQELRHGAGFAAQSTEPTIGVTSVTAPALERFEV